MKLQQVSSVFCLSLYLFLQSSLVLADVQSIREATGSTPSAIQGTIDSFRADLGSPNNGNATGSQGSGRREVSWDGGDSNAAPALMAGNFFNAVAPRGILISGTDARTQFQISADGIGNNPTNTVEEFGSIVASYPTAFQSFSSPRLFAAINATVVVVDFVVPGTLDPATVHGFGAVFVDVDTSATSKIEFYDVNGQLITERNILSSPGNASLSFLGISFTEAEVAQVRITTGEAVLGQDDVTQNGSNPDIVVLDNFIYGEPQQRAPAAPLISAPANNATLTTALPTVSGVAQAGSVLDLLDSGNSIGMTTTGSDGTWSLTPNTILSDGEHTLTATASNAAGTSDPSDAVDVTITTSSDTAPATPSISSPEEGATLTTPLPSFSGTGDEGSTITVFDSDSAIGSTVVGPNGQWSVFSNSLLAEGSHSVTAIASTTAGNSAASPALTVTIDATPDVSPSAPGITTMKRQVQIEMPSVVGVSAYKIRALCRGKGKRKIRKNYIVTTNVASIKKPRGKRCTYQYAILGNGQESPFSARGK